MAGISDMAAGNSFLPEFMKRFNEKFSVPATKAENMHRRLNVQASRLADILCDAAARRTAHATGLRPLATASPCAAVYAVGHPENAPDGPAADARTRSSPQAPDCSPATREPLPRRRRTGQAACANAQQNPTRSATGQHADTSAPSSRSSRPSTPPTLNCPLPSSTKIASVPACH